MFSASVVYDCPDDQVEGESEEAREVAQRRQRASPIGDLETTLEES